MTVTDNPNATQWDLENGYNDTGGNFGETYPSRVSAYSMEKKEARDWFRRLISFIGFWGGCTSWTFCVTSTVWTGYGIFVPWTGSGIQNSFAYAWRSPASLKTLLPCAIITGSVGVRKATNDHHFRWSASLWAKSTTMLFQFRTSIEILQSVHATKLWTGMPFKLHSCWMWLCKIFNAK